MTLREKEKAIATIQKKKTTTSEQRQACLLLIKELAR